MVQKDNMYKYNTKYIDEQKMNFENLNAEWSLLFTNESLHFGGNRKFVSIRYMCPNVKN